MRNRRLVGPTLIAIALCALVMDHLLLGESRWSASRFLGKFLAVLAAIFAPAINPLHYGWVADAFFPLSLVALVLVLLWLSFAGAKRAMSRATPGTAVADFTQPPQTARQQQAPEGVVLAPVKAASKMRQKSRLSKKLATSFAVIGGVFCIAACVAVSRFLGSVVDKQVESRAEVMTLGFHDAVTAAMLVDGAGTADAAVEKHAAKGGVAYVYVEDGSGRILAHRPNDLPRYLRRDFPRSTERALTGSRGEYRGIETYELAKPIADGKSGFIHMAVARQAVATEIRQAIVTITGVVLLALCGVIGGFVFAVRRLNCPFSELVSQAERISDGDFDVTLELQAADEVGDIARSLERLRSSLRAVTARLEEPQVGQRSNR